MNHSTIKVWITSGLALAIVLFVIKIQFGLGMLLGLIGSGYNLRRNIAFTDYLLNQQSKKGLGFFFLTSFVVILICLLLAILFPDIFNIFTVALGLLWIKPIILIKEGGRK